MHVTVQLRRGAGSATPCRLLTPLFPIPIDEIALYQLGPGGEASCFPLVVTCAQFLSTAQRLCRNTVCVPPAWYWEGLEYGPYVAHGNATEGALRVLVKQCFSNRNWYRNCCSPKSLSHWVSSSRKNPKSNLRRRQATD